MLARVSENRQPPGSALCIPRLREGRLFETAAARPPQDEELSLCYQRLPHAEERPLRDAACGGSSGQAGASQSTHRRDAANFLTASRAGKACYAAKGDEPQSPAFAGMAYKRRVRRRCEAGSMAAIIFANCAVLDGTSRERREDHHVLVEGDRIREVSDQPI